MTALNALLVRVADAVLGPLAGLPPLAVLLALALMTALAVLGAMKLVSNQTQMAAAKRRIHADLLEMRLYNDDLRALLRAQGALLRHNGSYIWLSLLPVAVTALPLTLAIAQVQGWYGYTGLDVGTATTVTVDLRGAGPAQPPTLDAPSLSVDGPGIYFPSLHQVLWRVVPREPGSHQLRVVVDGTSVEKTVDIGAGVSRRSPSRAGPGLVTQLLYPSEPPVPDGGPVAAIRLDYPERDVPVFGYPLHWLVIYVAASFAFVLALRGPLGIVI
ncbi:MAG: hypothetical protein ABI880_14300 [Acidobacteriota bacterium]